jgi:hypothetical protein
VTAMTDHQYKGNAPVQARDKVIVIDDDGTEREAKVHSVLAVQFLAQVPRQGYVFRFYADKGATWRAKTSD